MDINYESALSLYQEFFEQELHLEQLTNSLKIIAIAFFLLNVYTNMFSKLGNRLGNAQLPFDQSKLFSSVFMVLLIIFYDKLLGFLDGILLGLDGTYSHFSPTDFAIEEPELKVSEDEADSESMMKEFAADAIQIFADPTYIIFKLLEGIAWVVDVAMYGIFLLERFFIIGLLKVLGAFAIAISVFEKFRDLFYKWIKLYIAVYLLIFPFFLILGFAAFAFEFFSEPLKQFPIGTTPIKVVLLTILIWFKLRLFKKSYDIVYKVFA